MQPADLGATQLGVRRIRDRSRPVAMRARLRNLPATLVRTACALALLNVPGHGHASSATDRGDPAALTLRDALDRALDHNRDLAAFEHRIAEQQGRVQQAGLPPNPQLSVALEDAAGTDDFEGLDGAQTTLSLEWVLEGRRRARRVQAAETGAELVAVDARILHIEVAAETAAHFLDSLAGQVRLARADEAIELAEQAVEAVGRRVGVGRTAKLDLVRAQAGLASERLVRDDVEHELSTAYRRLSAQWGAMELDFARVEGDLLTLPSIAPYSTLVDALDRNPQLTRYATEERLARARLGLAEAQRWPALRPHLGVRRFETSDDVALVAGLTLPLPVLDRNQGQIAASRASVNRLRAEGEAAHVRLRTTLFALHEELRHHMHRAEALRAEIVPRLAEAAEGIRQGYAQGRYSYADLRSVQADVLRARAELIDASTGAHRLVIALERLTGERVIRR